MKTFSGQDVVDEGYYLNTSNWEFESVATSGGILSGDSGTRHIRLALPIVMVIGPVIGLVYVVLSPTAYCLASLYLLACRTKGAVTAIGGRLFLRRDRTTG